LQVGVQGSYVVLVGEDREDVPLAWVGVVGDTGPDGERAGQRGEQAG
jgi:hypothetical protein